MHMPVRLLSLSIALGLPALAAGEGFFDDAKLKVLNRNFYMSQDFREGMDAFLGKRAALWHKR